MKNSALRILIALLFVISAMSLFATPGVSKRWMYASRRKSCIVNMDHIATNAAEYEAAAAAPGSSLPPVSMSALVASYGVVEKCPPANPYSLLRAGGPPAPFDVYCPMHGHLSRANGEDQGRGITDLPIEERLENNQITSIVCFFLALFLLAMKIFMPADKEAN